MAQPSLLASAPYYPVPSLLSPPSRPECAALAVQSWTDCRNSCFLLAYFEWFSKGGDGKLHGTSHLQACYSQVMAIGQLQEFLLASIMPL